MKGGSCPAKQVHQCRENPWMQTEGAIPGFKKRLVGSTGGKALSKREVLFGKWGALPARAKSEKGC